VISQIDSEEINMH